jgi:hypothetical protein
MSRRSPILQLSMFFAGASHARTSAPQAGARGSGERPGAGILSFTSSVSSTRSDLPQSLSRTSSVGSSAGFLAWCRSSGIEVIDPMPFLSAPSTSGPRTAGGESSLWLTPSTVDHASIGPAERDNRDVWRPGLQGAVNGDQPIWPTPRARDSNGPKTGQNAEGSESLGEAVNWATPSARDWKSGASNKHGANARPLNEQVASGDVWPTPTTQRNPYASRRGVKTLALSGAVLYPTPSAHPYGSNRGGEAGREGQTRPSLETEAATWPTPQSRDEKGPTGMAGRLESGGQRSSLSDAAMPGATRGRLNPAWVATLMGFHTTWLDTPSPPAVAKSKRRGSRRARSRKK